MGRSGDKSRFHYQSRLIISVTRIKERKRQGQLMGFHEIFKDRSAAPESQCTKICFEPTTVA